MRANNWLTGQALKPVMCFRFGIQLPFVIFLQAVTQVFITPFLYLFLIWKISFLTALPALTFASYYLLSTLQLK